MFDWILNTSLALYKIQCKTELEIIYVFIISVYTSLYISLRLLQIFYSLEILHFFVPFKKFLGHTLREKCPNTEFFWSVFSRIRTECRKIRTRKNPVFGYFQRSDMICIICENDFQWSGDVRVSCCNKIINFKFCLRVIYEHLVAILLMEMWQTLHSIFLQIFLFLYW